MDKVGAVVDKFIDGLRVRDNTLSEFQLAFLHDVLYMKAAKGEYVFLPQYVKKRYEQVADDFNIIDEIARLEGIYFDREIKKRIINGRWSSWIILTPRKELLNNYK